uniref:Heparanase-like protein 2 n=1 Tax=Nelumbo nucifera TaxID=4432 RepID=A0A822YKA2_NELNU|nr:TPA_asm: hypothetical protein HUJ06_010256 [Nelumbo nucifera]
MTSIVTIDDNFVCATLDWWPTGKCSALVPRGKSIVEETYATSKLRVSDRDTWAKAGILNLDLNTILDNAVKSFNSLRIRIGGSLQDQILYKVGNAIKECPSFSNDTKGLFGFSQDCLTMERWDQINTLLTFGLNALTGRKKVSDDNNLYVGNWNPKNARDLMRYTISKGCKIDSWELGNELCGGGVAARILPDQYAKDVKVLRRLINKLYKDEVSTFYDEEWFSVFLQASGPNVVDGVTHHIYNLGPSDSSDIQGRFNNHPALGPWSSAWVGESGGAYNSGGKDVSHTFVNGFCYLDQLGMTSTFNHKVFCKQALIGRNYALLNTTSLIPNPDYYGALLWYRLMGRNVLSTTHNGSPYLRVYSHCSKHQPGITLLLINMSNSTSFNVSVVNDLNLYPLSQNKQSAKAQSGQQREEYHLTPKDGNIQSDVVLLNGTPLVLTEDSDIPPLNPIKVGPSSPINIAPDSVVFATLQGFKPPPKVKRLFWI